MRDPLKDPDITAAIARTAHVWHTAVRITAILEIPNTQPRSLIAWAIIKAGPNKPYTITYCRNGNVIAAKR